MATLCAPIYSRRPSTIAPTDYDVVIVGAGCAGLGAALVLGRCRRRVLVCDGGAPRNAPSSGVHAFLSRDGIKPQELLRISREQLEPYPSVVIRPGKVTNVSAENHGFTLIAESESGRPATITTRKLLLATGVDDELPPLDGMRELWGRGVLHCPYCHGWEVQDKALAVYGRGKMVVGLALLISRWSRDVVVCTDGPMGISANARRRLQAQGITVREEPIIRLQGNRRGDLKCILFKNGDELERDALFVHAHQHQRGTLAEQLGCRTTSKGAVWTDKYLQTSMRGVYAAGDMTPGSQQALIAAAEGTQAGIFLNERLTKEECV
ncbi:NAD(P)/FAD-dependent oxidoreductase [Hymenobacter sp. GOD-10R]|uniref:NAD(P)/FAD-dependent oxidoreductase n=1 Tax=Hymenobacter sp. GOD-10R TaxID=3093922 RepID=UPI002D773104|nr:NAD(P)/FAD-dependent oxidoreductase [Hymenobacter sp. GOD-10R]WRQ28688.1 NAD(P)/FAD-dependent oxidoreductase [Hymenobacter sp. GOD-10R]